MSDVSAVTKYFATANEGFTTTLSGTATAGTTTVGLNDVINLVNGTVFVGIVEPGATNQQVFTGTVDTSGSQITSVHWTRGNNVDHPGGVTVVDYVTGTDFNMLITGILKQHAQSGAHVGINNTGGLTNASGLTNTGGLTTDTAHVTGASTLDGAITGAGYSLGTMTNPYKFSAYRNASLNSGNGADAIVTFDTKLFDTGTNYSTSTGLFTAPIAGFYNFYWNVHTTNSTLYWLSFLYKNGTTFVVGSAYNSANVTTQFGSHGSIKMQLAANDTIGIYSRSNGGTAVAVGAAPIYTYFSGGLETSA